MPYMDSIVPDRPTQSDPRAILSASTCTCHMVAFPYHRVVKLSGLELHCPQTSEDTFYDDTSHNTSSVRMDVENDSRVDKRVLLPCCINCMFN